MSQLAIASALLLAAVVASVSATKLSVQPLRVQEPEIEFEQNSFPHHHGGPNRNPLLVFNEEILIEELSLRGFVCTPRHEFGHRVHVGHLPRVRGSSLARRASRPLVAGGASLREGSVSNLGRLQSSQQGAVLGSTNLNKNTLASQNNAQELDNNKNVQSNVEQTRQHQVVNNDKTIVLDRGSATNDVTNVRQTTNENQNQHLNSQNNQLVADAANQRTEAGAAFDREDAAEVASLREGSSTNVGGFATL